MSWEPFWEEKRVYENSYKTPFNSADGNFTGSPKRIKKMKMKDKIKMRLCSDGLLLFDRKTGKCILVDEVSCPKNALSKGPRNVSIALSNRCDLSCAYCYAPKSSHQLEPDTVKKWINELDGLGTMGIGFGGGEPLLYPHLTELLEHIKINTSMAASLTTHGHHFCDSMIDKCDGMTNMIRVSIDGAGATYERLRKRSFNSIIIIMKKLSKKFAVGINTVINESTIGDLTTISQYGNDLGARELLLLPQVDSNGNCQLSQKTEGKLLGWISTYRGQMRLAIGEAMERHFPEGNALKSEDNTSRYAHISAKGDLLSTSYSTNGVPLEGTTVALALRALTKKKK